MVEGIIEGAGAAVAGGVVVGVFVAARRLWHTPKRLDRIERVLPAMVRALQALLISQKNGACNGEVDASIRELRDLTTDGIVSQKERE